MNFVSRDKGLGYIQTQTYKITVSANRRRSLPPGKFANRSVVTKIFILGNGVLTEASIVF